MHHDTRYTPYTPSSDAHSGRVVLRQGYMHHHGISIDINVSHLLANAYMTYTVATVLMQRNSEVAEPPL
jgi:hypothetical protein